MGACRKELARTGEGAGTFEAASKARANAIRPPQGSRGSFTSEQFRSRPRANARAVLDCRIRQCRNATRCATDRSSTCGTEKSALLPQHFPSLALSALTLLFSSLSLLFLFYLRRVPYLAVVKIGAEDFIRGLREHREHERGNSWRKVAPIKRTCARRAAYKCIFERIEIQIYVLFFPFGVE